MPLTPFHLGPGLLFKAVFRGAFSLMVFGWATVLIDLEPLIALTTGWGEVHGWSHTWVGAIAIGAVATVSGKPLADLALRLVARDSATRLHVRWWVAAASAYVGTLSHILLDGLMHSDMHPFAPWSDAQPWLGAISVSQVYLLCVVTGAIGAVAWLAALAWKSRRPASG